jgi:hypothetical protein
MDYSYTTTPSDSYMQGSPFFILFGLAMFILAIISIIGMWKVFVKAGKPGWAAIIPIYNFIVQCEIVGRPLWWVLLGFIPFVNIVISLIIAIDTAKVFGKSPAFGVLGLWLFSVIGYIVLGFGDASYTPPMTSEPMGTPNSSAMPLSPSPTSA